MIGFIIGGIIGAIGGGALGFCLCALIVGGKDERVEGEWIEHDDDWCGAYYTCSVCKCDWTTIDGTPQENNMRYCPECGAHMSGGNNDE